MNSWKRDDPSNSAGFGGNFPQGSSHKFGTVVGFTASLAFAFATSTFEPAMFAP